MPVYLFQSAKDGSVVERFYPMRQAPSIGSRVVIDGDFCTRVASPCQQKKPWQSYVSNSLPRWVPGVRRYDDIGRPVFGTQQEEREFKAANLEQDKKFTKE